VLGLAFTGLIGQYWMRPIFSFFFEMPYVPQLVQILFR